MLACSRPDTLYVVMTRHPKAWRLSTERQSYDLQFDRARGKWTLLRPNPRRMPPLALRFDSLLDAWAYYVRGYLAWEESAAGKNCRAGSDVGRRNCLGGANEIPSRNRNVVLVRYEGE